MKGNHIILTMPGKKILAAAYRDGAPAGKTELEPGPGVKPAELAAQLLAALDADQADAGDLSGRRIRPPAPRRV